MFGVTFSSSTSSSNWPPDLGHRPSLRPTPVSPLNANQKLQHYRDTRHALTVALVKPGRGACWNQARNSSSAMLYTLFVIGEETLSSTSVFNFSHPAIL